MTKYTLRAGLSLAALGALGAIGIMATPAYAQSADTTNTNANQQSSTDETIVVTGQRAALRSAQNIKRNADEIVDSIVADDIGKLPDRSVTEVLQRVVGVTIDHTYRDISGNTDPEHFAVEGAGVAIRGLTYVRSEINGRDSFTANGGRSLSFDDVSPELMAGVDVYKNPSAEQIEGAIGGLVNLRTAMPFDFSGARVGLSAQASWGDLNRNVPPKPSASILLSDRWSTGIGDIGVLLDLAHSESATRTDGIELEPFFPRVSSLEPATSWIPAGQTVWVPRGGVSWRTLAFDRKRDGAYGALQWRPNESLETSLTFFRSAYQFHWDEDAIFPAANPYTVTPKCTGTAPNVTCTSFTFGANGQLISGELSDPTDGGLPFNDDVRSADRHSVTTDVSWNTRWDVNDRLAFKSDLQFVRSTTNAGDFTVATGVNLPSETMNLGGGVPTASVDQSFLTDPSNYYWAFTMDGFSRAVGKEWSWRGDADYTIGDGFFKSIRAGVRATERDALTQVSEPGNGYNWAAVTQTWQVGWYVPNLAYLPQFPAPYQVYAFPNFFNGNESLPSKVVFPATSLATGWPQTFATLQNFQTILCQQLNPSCVNGWAPAGTGSQDAGLNTQDERTYSAYLVARFGADSGPLPFDGNIGVRVVRTLDTAHGFLSVSSFSIPNPLPPGHTANEYVALNAFYSPINERNTYTDVLPSLNLRFHLTDNLQARVAVAKAIARPDFSQLQAFTTLSSGIDSGSGVQTFGGSASGNPMLKPTRSNQFDATLEWYFAPTGSLTGAVFYKDLSDVIINQVFTVTANDANGAPHEFTTSGPVNGANGTVKGFELAYQQYFDFLPGALKGFGLQANFTYVDSERTLYTPVPAGTYCSTSLSLALNGCDTDGRTFGNLPLQNLSKYAYNLSLLYDRGPLSARLAYSWRDKYLMAVNVNGTNGGNGLNTDPSSPSYGQQNVPFGLPTWAHAYGQLDGSVFYKLNDHLTFGFEAQNLTDAIYKELQQQHIGMLGRAWYDSGRRFTAQIRASF